MGLQKSNVVFLQETLQIFLSTLLSEKAPNILDGIDGINLPSRNLPFTFSLINPLLRLRLHTRPSLSS